MVRRLLMELEDHNCWAITGAVGIAGLVGRPECGGYRVGLGGQLSR
jgi:hypothetical protein